MVDLTLQMRQIIKKYCLLKKINSSKIKTLKINTDDLELFLFIFLCK